MLPSHSDLSARELVCKTAGFQAQGHVWQTKTQDEMRPHHKVSEKFSVLTLIADRSGRPWPPSCPSLNRINPNYRHRPLKPKYYSQARLLAPRLWIVWMHFTPSTCLKEFNVPRRFKLSSPHEAVGSSVARTQSAWRSPCVSAPTAWFPRALLYARPDWLGDGEIAFERLVHGGGK